MGPCYPSWCFSIEGRFTAQGKGCVWTVRKQLALLQLLQLEQVIAKASHIDSYRAVGKTQFLFAAHFVCLVLFESSDSCIQLELAECCEQICPLVLDIEQAILYRLFYFFMVIFTFYNCESTY